MPEQRRLFTLAPCLLEEAPIWTGGPLWKGDREDILKLQSILLDTEIKKLGAKLIDEFNERAIKFGIQSAIKHGSDPKDIAKILKG